MKKLYLWVVLFMTIFSANAQITVSGTPASSSFLPIRNGSTAYKTLSQQIYYPSEIKAAGAITGITFHGTTPWTIGTGANQWKVSLGHTTKTEFATAAAAEIIDTGLTEVFDGTVAVVNGKLSITFTTPFNYNGTDNLVVVVDEYNNAVNSVGYVAEASVFVTTNSPSLVAYTNSATGSLSYSKQAAKCIVTFEGITPSCEAPNNLKVSDVTATTAKINWDAPTTPPSGGYEYIVSTSSTYPSLSATPTGTIANTGTFVNIASLSESTEYFVFVRSVCGGTGGYWSDAISFKTECPTSYTTLTEDFSSVTSVSTGIGSVPACWQRYFPGTGLVRVQTTSGNNFLSLWKAAAYANPIAVLPILSNISEGTHQLRFKARAITASSVEDLQIGYVTNAFDPSTFVSLQSLSSLTTTNQEFIVKYNGTIPAGARVAIKLVANAFRYVDDVVWEVSTTMNVSDNASSKTVATYPNPVKDILNISSDAKVSQIEVYDLAGSKVLDKKSQDLATVNVSKLVKGNYMVIITLINGEKVTKKIIKE